MGNPILDTEKTEKEINKHKLANERYIALINELLRFASSKSKFTLDDFFEAIKQNAEYSKMLQSKNTYLVFHYLYKTEIDISSQYKKDDRIPINPSGEFDLSYCLYKISDKSSDFYNIKKISIKIIPNEKIIYPVKEENIQYTVDNLIFEVIYND